MPNRFVLFVRFVFKRIKCSTSCVPPVSAPPRTKIREIHELRVRIKEEIRVRLERQREIRVQEKNHLPNPTLLK